MQTTAEIIAGVLVVVPVAFVLWLFVWGARKDGEYDRSVQARVGIRRRRTGAKP